MLLPLIVLIEVVVLALFWHESVDLYLIEKHRRFIDVHVRESGTLPLSNYLCLW